MTNGQALKRKVALITGGGGEIATAIAQRFADEGARLVLFDVSGVRAEATAKSLHAGGHEALVVVGDVSLADDARRAVADTVKAFGGLHILVNNAVASTADGTVETLALEDWNRVMAVNLGGAFLMCKYAVPEIRRAGGGAIVNIASQLGHMGTSGRSPYCTSKAGLLHFTRILAMDHATDNIRVNSISPGVISTSRSSARYGSKENASRARGPKHLLGRPGRVEEIGAAALYLASDESSFVTAADLLVDGGYVVFKGEVDSNRRIVEPSPPKA